MIRLMIIVKDNYVILYFFTVILAQVHPLLDKVRKMSRTFRVTRFYALTHPWRHTHIQ